MVSKVFLVDDDPNLLKSFGRHFRKRFDLLTATSAQEALEHSFSNDPVAVVVADMRMPGMDGLQLLLRIRDISPDTVRIMLTGNTDQKTALDAINQGRIFRFFYKPCPAEVLGEAIDEAIAEYERKVAEREILDDTFADIDMDLTGVVVGSVLNLVKKVAVANKGVLLLSQLEAIDNEFSTNPGTLGRVIQRSFEEYILARDKEKAGQAYNEPCLSAFYPHPLDIESWGQ